MESFILDSSVTMGWAFVNQKNDLSAKARLILENGGTAYVPEHWMLEVINSLIVAERRKMMVSYGVTHFCGILKDMDIIFEINTPFTHHEAVILLAREHTLSSYDAAYLELAFRKGLPLATRDEALRKTAKKIGVRLL